MLAKMNAPNIKATIAKNICGYILIGYSQSTELSIPGSNGAGDGI